MVTVNIDSGVSNNRDTHDNNIMHTSTGTVITLRTVQVGAMAIVAAPAPAIAIAAFIWTCPAL
eukprot:1313151-Alexandrium_andersonii.AAC.1